MPLTLLHWFSVGFWLEIKVLVVTFKALSGGVRLPILDDFSLSPLDLAEWARFRFSQ